MIHARKKGDCEAFVEQHSKEHGLDDVAILYSTTEFKKVRLAYFTDAFAAWERAHITGAETRLPKELVRA
jgi:hypothetical protein